MNAFYSRYPSITGQQGVLCMSQLLWDPEWLHLDTHIHNHDRRGKKTEWITHCPGLSARSVTFAHISLAKARLIAIPNFASGEAEAQRAQKADSQNYFVNRLHSGPGWSPLGSSGGAIDAVEFNCTVSIKIKWLGFPGGAVIESLPANAGDMGSSPGLGGSHMPQSN